MCRKNVIFGFFAASALSLLSCLQSQEPDQLIDVELVDSLAVYDNLAVMATDRDTSILLDTLWRGKLQGPDTIRDFNVGSRCRKGCAIVIKGWKNDLLAYHSVTWIADGKATTQKLPLGPFPVNSGENSVRKFTIAIVPPADSTDQILIDPDSSVADSGSCVTIKAVPGEGRAFSNWLGALSTELKEMEICVDSDLVIGAEFRVDSLPAEMAEVQWKLNPENGGTITGLESGRSYVIGARVEVVAHPQKGYRFHGWAGDLDGKNAKDTLIIDADPFVEAVFTALPLAVDSMAPTLTVESHKERDTVAVRTGIVLSGKAWDASGIRNIEVNGEEAFYSPIDSLWSADLGPLDTTKGGVNAITVSAWDIHANHRTLQIGLTYFTSLVDTIAPIIKVISPEPGDTVATKKVTVVVDASDSQSGLAFVRIDGETAVLEDGRYRREVDLKVVGKNDIVILATDASSNANSETLTLSVHYDPDFGDRLPPVMEVKSHSNGQKVAVSTQTIRIIASDSGSGIDSVSVGGKKAELVSGEYRSTVQLKNGDNQIALEAVDRKGNIKSQQLNLVLDPGLSDNTPPQIAITSLAIGDTVAISNLTLVLDVGDAESGIASVKVAGKDALLLDGRYQSEIKLSSIGKNIIEVSATDNSPNSNVNRMQIEVFYFPTYGDRDPPAIRLVHPLTLKDTVTISNLELDVEVTDASKVSSVTIDGKPAKRDGHHYKHQMELKEGKNNIAVSAKDSSIHENLGSIELEIHFDPPPAAVNLRSAVQTSGKAVTLKWSPFVGADFIAYDIRYAETPGVTAQSSLLTSKTSGKGDTTYVANGLPGGKEYYFKVFVRDNASSTGSNEVKVFVRHLPEFSTKDAWEVDEGEPLTIVLQASDPHGDGLVFGMIKPPVDQGSSFDPQTATFSWTPAYRQSGIFSAVFEVRNAILPSLVDTLKAYLQVNPVNLDSMKIRAWLDSIGYSELDVSTIAQFKSGNAEGLTFHSAIFKTPFGPIPDFVGELTELRNLSITLWELKSLPDTLRNLKKLERLTVTNASKMTEFPKVVLELPSLTRLILLYNGMATVPEEINQLTKLKSLSLSTTSGQIPASIFGMSKLEDLQLPYLGLTSLPLGLTSMIQLRYLSLQGNQLTSLPTEIGDLVNLESLAISSNALDALPLSIRNLTKLTNLDLDYNKFDQIPTFIADLPSIRVIQFNSNRLTSLPDELASIKHISVERNQISTIPAGFLNSFIDNLYIADNKLCSLSKEEKDWLDSRAPYWSNQACD